MQLLYYESESPLESDTGNFPEVNGKTTAVLPWDGENNCGFTIGMGKTIAVLPWDGENNCGFTMGMGKTIAVLPWGQQLQFYHGYGENNCGFTMGMGTTIAVSPWGWGQQLRIYHGDGDNNCGFPAVIGKFEVMVCLPDITVVYTHKRYNSMQYLASYLQISFQ